MGNCLVPGAANGCALEDGHHCAYGARDGDVADCRVDDFSSGWECGEAEIEEQHGDLSHGEVGAAENGSGIIVLVVG